MLIVMFIVLIYWYGFVFFGSCCYCFGISLMINVIGGVICCFINGVKFVNNNWIVLCYKFIVYWFELCI